MYKAPIAPGMIVWYIEPVPKKIYERRCVEWDLTGTHMVMVVGREEWNHRVTCIMATSREDAPGFELDMCNQGANGRKTIFMPYNIINPKVKNLGAVIGFAPPQLYEAVKSAMAFHLGFSNEVPPYLKPLEEEFYTLRTHYGARKPMENVEADYHRAETSLEITSNFLPDEKIPGNLIHQSEEKIPEQPIVIEGKEPEDTESPTIVEEEKPKKKRTKPRTVLPKIERPKLSRDSLLHPLPERVKKDDTTTSKKSWKNTPTKADKLYAKLTDDDKKFCRRHSDHPTEVARHFNITKYFAQEMIKRSIAEYSSTDPNTIVNEIKAGAYDVYSVPKNRTVLLDKLSEGQWNELGVIRGDINTILAVYGMSRHVSR